MKRMTISDAIIKTLNDFPDKALSSEEIYKHIVDKKYYTTFNTPTESASVGSTCSKFIREKDRRIQRIKGEKGVYFYYLSKNRKNINREEYEKSQDEKINFEERDLHKLLSTCLHGTNVYSKTIFHEKSNSDDNHTNWIHPDMVGIHFLSDEMKDKSKSSQKFMKTINLSDTIEISSYELKSCIKSDRELKKSYFQAVSNSSWANYGYLVAFDIDDSDDDFKAEMKRLNQDFGIGIISLKAKPFETEILYPAKYRDLNFVMIDKLCNTNPDFREFIEYVSTSLTAEENTSEINEEKFDKYFDYNADEEIKIYCETHNILMKSSEAEE
jgi:hypothetical protein